VTVRTLRRMRRAGFSLVELIAALSIFSVGVLAVLEVTGSCLRSTSASSSYTHAVQLARQALEETVAEGALFVSTETGDFGAEYPRHTWLREIEETDRTDVLKLRVTVMWSERGREKKYALTTLQMSESKWP